MRIIDADLLKKNFRTVETYTGQAVGWAIAAAPTVSVKDTAEYKELLERCSELAVTNLSLLQRLNASKKRVVPPADEQFFQKYCDELDAMTDEEVMEQARLAREHSQNEHYLEGYKDEG